MMPTTVTAAVLDGMDRLIPVDMAAYAGDPTAYWQQLGAWWGNEGVDYHAVEEWAASNAVEDIRAAFVSGRLLVPQHLAAMLATAYELAFMFGWQLAKGRRP